jgi:hypothetical protein
VVYFVLLSHQNLEHFSLLPMCHMLPPPHSSWLDLSNDIWGCAGTVLTTLLSYYKHVNIFNKLLYQSRFLFLIIINLKLHIWFKRQTF